MGRYTKKLAKAIGGELQPGEQLLAGCKVLPAGGIAKTAVNALMTGQVGTVASSGDGGQAEPLANGLPIASQMGLAITTHKLVTCGLSTMTGSPNRVLGSLPLAALASLGAEERRIAGLKAGQLTLQFTDGTSLYLEAPRTALADWQEVVTVLRQRLAL